MSGSRSVIYQNLMGGESEDGARDDGEPTVLSLGSPVLGLTRVIDRWEGN